MTPSSIYRDRSTNDRRQGLTLIEMSMVLLIIALLSGGIFMAQSMIRQAEIRTVASEYENMRSAIEEFRIKYMGFPGDIINAEDIWGSDNDCPATETNETPKKPTCNGDGNGTIGDSTNTAELTDSHEWFRAWQQLSNAGLIQGSYTGVSGEGSNKEAVISTNVPASKLAGGGWTLNYILRNTDGILWGDQYGHVLNFGSFVKGDYTKGKIMSPQEAFSFDAKVDDGIPNTGFIRTWTDKVLTDCTEKDAITGYTVYNADLTEYACSLVFVLGF